MPYFKFIQSEHIDKVLKEGLIRVSSLDFFSYLEEATGDAWIGDALERGSRASKMERPRSPRLIPKKKQLSSFSIDLASGFAKTRVLA